ncbi:AAA family ATPase [Haliangium sp.]|uniref:AAA family ATPase n=1 Tax=Haliangium sp. TaxID=2663208 RepID=UPI003D125B73
MLLEFRVENYRSIADEQRLLMAASNDGSLADNVHSPEAPGDVTGRFRLLKSALLYGANGSGKSTLVRAIALVRHLVVHSASDYKPGDPLPIEPFRLSAELAHAPSRFEITFFHGGVRYQYGFAADRERVHEEWLLAYPEGRAQTWFERNQDEWTFGPNLKGEKKRIAEVTRPNSLFLAAAAAWNQQQLDTVSKWFRNTLRILAHEPWQSKARLPGSDINSFTVHKVAESDDFRDKVARLLCAADLGIEAVDVEFQELGDTGLLESLPEEVRKELLTHKIRLPRVRTRHRSSDGAEIWFDLDDESDGTQHLFALLGPWLDTIESGYVVVVDEVFSNLHPLLTRTLIESFHCVTGKAPAQVILTTHDSSLLDPKLLRRDQIMLLEKTPPGACRLYSLLDYKPRKDEALQRGYLSGRYGGVPFLEDFGL